MPQFETCDDPWPCSWWSSVMEASSYPHYFQLRSSQDASEHNVLLILSQQISTYPALNSPFPRLQHLPSALFPFLPQTQILASTTLLEHQSLPYRSQTFLMLHHRFAATFFNPVFLNMTELIYLVTLMSLLKTETSYAPVSHMEGTKDFSCEHFLVVMDYTRK